MHINQFLSILGHDSPWELGWPKFCFEFLLGLGQIIVGLALALLQCEGLPFSREFSLPSGYGCLHALARGILPPSSASLTFKLRRLPAFV